MENSELIPLLNKALIDELTAAVVYRMLAEKVIDAPTLACELRSHADEEMAHFNDLIAFANNRGMDESLNIVLDDSVLADIPSGKFAVIKKVQELETIAIQDYRNIALKARSTNDLEVENIFMELMMNEIEHFDELAQYTGEHR